MFCDLRHPELINRSVFKVFPVLESVDVDIGASSCITALHAVNGEKLDLDVPCIISNDAVDTISRLEDAMASTIRRQFCSLMAENDVDHMLSPFILASSSGSRSASVLAAAAASAAPPAATTDTALEDSAEDSAADSSNDSQVNSSNRNSNGSGVEDAGRREFSMHWVLDKVSQVACNALLVQATAEEDYIRGQSAESQQSLVKQLQDARHLQVEELCNLLNGSLIRGDRVKLAVVSLSTIYLRDRVENTLDAFDGLKLRLTYDGSTDADSLQVHLGHVSMSYHWHLTTLSELLAVSEDNEKRWFSVLKAFKARLSVGLLPSSDMLPQSVACGVSSLLGLPLFEVDCNEQTSFESLSCILRGSISMNCVVHLNAFHLISDFVTSPFAAKVEQIAAALAASTQPEVYFDSKTPVKASCAPLMILSFPQEAKQQLPVALRTSFRVVSLVAADATAARQAQMTACGIAQEELGERALEFMEAVQTLIPASWHVNTLSQVIKVFDLLKLRSSFSDEQAALVHALVTVLGAKCSSDADTAVFNQCLQSFFGIDSTGYHGGAQLVAASSSNMLADAAREVMHDRSLLDINSFFSRLLHFTELLDTQRVVMISGSVCTGKSELMQVVCEAKKRNNVHVTMHRIRLDAFRAEDLFGVPTGAAEHNLVQPPLLASLLCSDMQSVLPSKMDQVDAAELAFETWVVLEGTINPALANLFERFDSTGELHMFDGSVFRPPKTAKVVMESCQEMSCCSIAAVELNSGSTHVFAQHKLRVWMESCSDIAHLCREVCFVFDSFLEQFGGNDVLTMITPFGVVDTIISVYPIALAAFEAELNITKADGKLAFGTLVYVFFWAALGSIPSQIASQKQDCQAAETFLQQSFSELGVQFDSSISILEQRPLGEEGCFVPFDLSELDFQQPSPRAGEQDCLNSVYVPVARFESRLFFAQLSLNARRHVGVCGQVASGKSLFLRELSDRHRHLVSSGNDSDVLVFPVSSRSTPELLWERLFKSLDCFSNIVYEPAHSKPQLYAFLDDLDTPTYDNDTLGEESCSSRLADFVYQTLVRGVVHDSQSKLLGESRRIQRTSLAFSMMLYQGDLQVKSSIPSCMLRHCTMLAMPSWTRDEIVHVLQHLLTSYLSTVARDSQSQHSLALRSKRAAGEAAWVQPLIVCTLEVHENLIQSFTPTNDRVLYR